MRWWRRSKPLFVALSLSYLTAGVGAALTELGPWYFALKQPSWKPPDAAFGVIWTSIFTLTAISAAMAWQAAQTNQAQRKVWLLFGLNALLNVVWSALYFKLQRPDWALAEWLLLWLSVLSLVLGFWQTSRRTAYLNFPYLLWVTVAGGLNLATIRLNGPFT
jgi:tryptophan-rich sensory protein